MTEKLVLDFSTYRPGGGHIGTPRRLVLHCSYSHADAPWIASLLQLEHGSLALSYCFLCHGYDLNQFADGLRRLQLGDAESSTLFDQGEEVTITLTWADRGRGRLDAVAALDVLLPTGDGFDRQPATCRVGGFAIEQSYLRSMASDINGFLTFWDLPRNHPMIRA